MNKPLLALVLALVAFTACRPFAAAGESCKNAPCAFGLSCFEDVCVVPSIADAGPGPCESAADCAVGGNDDGRACIEGECVWAGCANDVDCGTRVCDRGECTRRQTCASDGDCDAGQVCENDACRAACASDTECGGALAVCADDGQCRQQCFLDLMCFGDLCVNGVCEAPECSADADCASPGGSFFCNGGRCESFLPCQRDVDCFDANYLCNDAGRCEERPLCNVDAECGQQGLCVDTHCRPTETCEQASDCEDGDECVAGRCVAEPGCRTSADCTGDQVCAGAVCRAPIPTTVASLVVGTPYGPCRADGTGACQLVLVAGEVATLRVVGLTDDGAPALPALTVVGPTGVTAASAGDGVVTLTATAAGTGALVAEVTGTSVSHNALTVTVVPAPPATDLAVLVVDRETGGPLAGATVRFAGSEATSGAGGVASLGIPTTYAGLLTVEHNQGGVALAGVEAAATLRVAILHPPAPGSVANSAGFRARVLSSGDETGEVGIGIALTSTRSPATASFAGLFGDVVTAQLTVPLLGGLPVELPAAATFEATLPLQGNAVVKEQANARSPGGPISVTAFEGRQGQQLVFQYLGGGDPVGTALDFAAAAEGFDVLWQQVGNVDALPLIADGDLADGIADYDGDGDTAELVPDWGQLPSVDVTPTRLATERVGVRVRGLPADARARAFAFAGPWLPGWGFAPLGMGVAALTGDAVDVQLKVHGPQNDALARAPRVVVIEALYADQRTSRVRVEAPAFGPDLDAGGLLTPPADAFFVDGLPAAGDRTLFLPAPQGGGATTYRVRLIGGVRLWELLLSAGAGGGRTIVIPPELGGLNSILVEVSVLRMAGADAEAATRSPFVVGSGPRPPVEESASAIAVAPAF